MVFVLLARLAMLESVSVVDLLVAARQEVAVQSAEACLTLLWDLRKCYEHVQHLPSGFGVYILGQLICIFYQIDHFQIKNKIHAQKHNNILGIFGYY